MLVVVVTLIIIGMQGICRVSLSVVAASWHNEEADLARLT